LTAGQTKKGNKVRAMSSGKTKADLKKEKEEEEAVKGIQGAQLYAEQYEFQRIKVPVGKLGPPARDIAARGLDEAHVKELMKAFKRTLTTEETISALLRNTAMADKLKDGNLELKDLAPFKFEVFTGYHSTVATQRLFEETKNPRWEKLPVKIYVAPSNHETIKEFRILGIADNKKKELHKKMTWGETIVSMHSKLYDAKNQRTAVTRKDVIETYYAAGGFTKPSLGNMATFAAKTGRLWNAYEKLFTGRGLARGVKVLGSQNLLLPLTKIPESTVADWMEKVIEGHMSWDEVRGLADSYKRTAALERHIVEYIESKAAGVKAGSSFKQLKLKFPKTCDPDLFKLHLQAMPRELKGWTPSAELSNDLDKRLAIDLGRRPNRSIAEVTFLVCAYLCRLFWRLRTVRSTRS
jgi:hypothetical protein